MDHVYKAELIKHDGKRVMRLFSTRTAAEDWQTYRQLDGAITITRLKVNN